MSWKGATCYDSWTIYSSTNSVDFIVVKTIPRTGFETATFVSGDLLRYTLGFVEAEDGNVGMANSSSFGQVATSNNNCVSPSPTLALNLDF